MAAPSGPKGAARTEAREANKGGIHGIGTGSQSAANANDSALSSAFAKHNAKGETQPDGHVPFQKAPK